MMGALPRFGVKKQNLNSTLNSKKEESKDTPKRTTLGKVNLNRTLSDANLKPKSGSMIERPGTARPMMSRGVKPQEPATPARSRLGAPRGSVAVTTKREPSTASRPGTACLNNTLRPATSRLNSTLKTASKVVKFQPVDTGDIKDPIL